MLLWKRLCSCAENTRGVWDLEMGVFVPYTVGSVIVAFVTRTRRLEISPIPYLPTAPDPVGLSIPHLIASLVLQDPSMGSQDSSVSVVGGSRS